MSMIGLPAHSVQELRKFRAAAIASLIVADREESENPLIH